METKDLFCRVEQTIVSELTTMRPALGSPDDKPVPIWRVTVGANPGAAPDFHLALAGTRLNMAGVIDLIGGLTKALDPMAPRVEACADAAEKAGL